MRPLKLLLYSHNRKLVRNIWLSKDNQNYLEPILLLFFRAAFSSAQGILLTLPSVALLTRLKIIWDNGDLTCVGYMKVKYSSCRSISYKTSCQRLRCHLSGLNMKHFLFAWFLNKITCLSLINTLARAIFCCTYYSPSYYRKALSWKNII